MTNTISKERICTSRNQKLINQKVSAQKTTAKLFNQVNDAYKNLGIDEELSFSDLIKLIKIETDTKDFVKARMLKGRKIEMEVGGLKLSPSAIGNMIEMPDLTELKEAIINFRKSFRYVDYLLDGLEMDGNQVIVSTQWEEGIIEENSLYADSEKEKELFTTMAEIVDRMNKMRTKYGIRHFVPGAHQVEVLFTHFCPDEKKFKVSANALKRHCQAKPAYEG